MTPRSSFGLAPFSLALLAATLASVTAASAQTPVSARPYRGLFAGDQGDFAESLTANGSIGGGWDSSVVSEFDPTSENVQDAFTLRGAGFTSFAGSLVYQKYGRRTQVAASGATSTRYYSSLANPFIGAHAAMLAFAYQFTESTALSLNQSLSYQPFGSLNMFPGVTTSTLQPPVQVAAAPGLDTRANNADLYSSSSGAVFSHALSDRSDVMATYRYWRTRFGGGRGNFQSQMAGGRFNRRLTRDLGLRLGYGYTKGRFVGSSQEYVFHQIDSGLAYNRVFSLSRRTTLGFDSGVAVVSNLNITRYLILGGAQVVHEIGRTFALSGVYRRGMQFIETLNQPIYSDAVTVMLAGQVSRRVGVNVGGGASRGNLSFSITPNHIQTYYATSGVSVAISRHLALNGAYNYFGYETSGGVYRVLGFRNELSRHSVSIMLAAWAPIFQKGPRSNASR
jgi:hypothetical protein